MLRDYTITSPSLYGILSHELVEYNNLRRPENIERIFDRPSKIKLTKEESATRRKALEEYFHDLYGILMKKVSEFAIEAECLPDEAVKLQAILQEFVKVKGLLMEKELT
ncbi:MAG: hypothetical protein NTZ38_00840 [Candidatus Taylorbacteria bacterium]|nr:hypothetical protein [Candidatus Taylorbacteria bacterium]